MTLLGAWRTPDGRIRVEVVNERGRHAYKVHRAGFLVAQMPTVERLAVWLVENEGLALADLIED